MDVISQYWQTKLYCQKITLICVFIKQILLHHNVQQPGVLRLLKSNRRNKTHRLHTKNFVSEKNLASTLKPTASKKAKSGKSNSSNKVNIPIGIKICNEDGLLKVLKGRTLPITVKPDIDARGLLEEAVNKHTKHFRSFDNKIEYVLLYPDNTVV